MAATGCGGEVHGDVEAVDEGDVVEVEVVKLGEGVLGEGVGRGAVGRALEYAAAVAGPTATLAIGVEVAACACPDAATSGASRGGDSPGLAGVELLASAGDCGSPDGVGALVYDVEVGGMGEEGEEEEKEQARHTIRPNSPSGPLIPQFNRDRRRFDISGDRTP